jgi:hypothetical protein
LRRDEAAKFFVEFAKYMGKTAHVVDAHTCNNLKDLDKAHADLRAHIIQSCRMGIFRGQNGNFLPDMYATNAHMMTALMRIMDGNQPEVGAHRSDNYYRRAREIGLSFPSDMNERNGLATRGNVILMMHNAKDIKTNNATSSGHSSAPQTGTTINTNLANSIGSSIFNTPATRGVCTDSQVLLACALGSLECPSVCVATICDNTSVQATCTRNPEKCPAMCKGRTVPPTPPTSSNSNRYPGCDTDDIRVGNYTIAACNVGASRAGTGSASYGGYYTHREALSVCASGYHLPSKVERDELYTLGIQNRHWEGNNGARFSNHLKLPFAFTAFGSYWTSTSS